MAEEAIESTVSAFFKKFGIAGILEVAGVIVFCAGAVQLFHHGAIAACVIGGACSFLVGKKLRTAS
jgi:hypothetical protein